MKNSKPRFSSYSPGPHGIKFANEAPEDMNDTKNYNLCIIKPNESEFSETFIKEHVNRLQGNKKVIYGGSFPLYDDKGNFLIQSKVGLLSYLIQKRIFKKKDIRVRTNALVKYLLKEKIDVVLAEYGMVGAMVTAACKIADIPLVIHFHGADAHCTGVVNEYKNWYRKAFEFASVIVAVSNDMVKSLRNLGAPEHKLVLNPYGINTALFSPDEVNNDPNFTFLFVGRFVAKKFPNATINAFNEVAKQFPDVRLVMVGDGPLLEESKALSSLLGLTEKIVFTGVLSTHEISMLMKQSSCYVQHSVEAPDGDMEGTPNSILEAAASGMPIVSTRHAGIKEAVLDGQSGFLVEEQDIEAMAEKMIELRALTPEALKEMGRTGRAHILNNYDIRDRIDTLNNILFKVVNDSRK